LFLLINHIAMPRVFAAEEAFSRSYAYRGSYSSKKWTVQLPCMCLCCGTIIIVVVGILFALTVAAFASPSLPINSPGTTLVPYVLFSLMHPSIDVAFNP
jgi:hypothetical protein